MGDQHDYTARIALIRNIDGGCDPRPGANGNADVGAGQQRNTRRRLDPRLSRRLESSGLALVRAAGIGARPDHEQDAWTPAARWRYRLAGIASDRGWRQQLRPAGRRLHQSDLAAMGGGDREEVRRNLAGRHHLPQRLEPVLARTDAVHFQAYANADASAVG